MSRIAVTLGILVAWPLLVLSACVAVTAAAFRALLEAWS